LLGIHKVCRHGADGKKYVYLVNICVTRDKQIDSFDHYFYSLNDIGWELFHIFLLQFFYLSFFISFSSQRNCNSNSQEGKFIGVGYRQYIMIMLYCAFILKRKACSSKCRKGSYLVKGILVLFFSKFQIWRV